MHHSRVIRKARPSWRRFAQRGYLVGVLLFILCVLCQVFLAGMSIFVSPAWWEVHQRFGESFGFLTILLLLFAIAMRPQRSIIWLTLLLIALYSLQYLLIELSGRVGIPWLSALHPVNALMIFWLAVTLGRSVFQQNGRSARIGKGAGTMHRTE